MRLLILSEEVWNDKLYPNNVMTNWFEGFDGQIANLYLASGTPDNPCCKEYFQITDRMAWGNLIGAKSGGRWFISKDSDVAKGHPPRIAAPPAQFPHKAEVLYKLIIPLVRQGIRLAAGGALRLLRDAVWLNTRWEETRLMDFLKAFKPDIIFSLRFSSRRMLYMERFLHSVTGAPVVAFTGDDEFSLRQINFSPFYWTRRFLLRKDIRQNAAFYRKYYTLSERQAKEFNDILGVNSGVLYKGGNFAMALKAKRISKPIRMVYAGRLYCNRDRTLRCIARALAKLNREEIRITLEIYTRDKPGKRARDAFRNERSVFLREAVSAERLRSIYEEADIALLAESFDLRNRRLTRYSFSTKIVDCLASTCAVIAVGPLDNEGIRYLKKNRGAVCIERKEEIYPVLSHIVSHPNKIEVYRRNAWRLGIKAHKKEVVRHTLYQELFSIRENVDETNQV